MEWKVLARGLGQFFDKSKLLGTLAIGSAIVVVPYAILWRHYWNPPSSKSDKEGPHHSLNIDKTEFEGIPNAKIKNQFLYLVDLVNERRRSANSNREKWKKRMNMSLLFTAISYVGMNLGSLKEFHPFFVHSPPFYSLFFRASVLLALHTTSCWVAYNESTNKFARIVTDANLAAKNLPTDENELKEWLHKLNKDKQGVIDAQNEDYICFIKRKLAESRL